MKDKTIEFLLEEVKRLSFQLEQTKDIVKSMKNEIYHDYRMVIPSIYEKTSAEMEYNLTSIRNAIFEVERRVAIVERELFKDGK